MSKSIITINLNNFTYVRPEIKVFNGGEVNVTIPNVKFPGGGVTKVDISASLLDSDGVMALLQVVDALKIRYPSIEKMNLFLPYIPYARQDRVCNKGESLTIKVFSKLINDLKFDRVVVLDPHSDVAPALLDNCNVISSSRIISSSGLGEMVCRGDFTLVSPDFGATKKLEGIAKDFGLTEVIQGYKTRDLKTGKLSEIGFHGDVEGKDLLIVDDICDGGGTFVGLSEKLYIGGANSVSLYVTHGIFSRGIEALTYNGIDRIWTTNSIPQNVNKDGVVVIDILAKDFI